MSASDLHVSQSLIKRIINRYGERADYCPHFIYRVYIKKDFNTVRTESMMWGLYGEQKILGMTRDDEKIEVPTNKRTGLPLVSQTRIDDQVDLNLPAVLQTYNIIIAKNRNVQVPVSKVFSLDGVNAIVTGHLDLFPTTILWDDEIRIALVDIKFTADVNSKYGDFCWGSPHKMDHFQADVYQWLVRDFDLKLNQDLHKDFDERVGYHTIFRNTELEAIKNDRLIFIYLIIGYDKTPLEGQIKLLQRTFYEEKVDHNTGETTYSNIRQTEMLQRIRQGIIELDHDAAEGYPLVPSWDNCNQCPVSKLNGGDCRGYSLVNKV